MLLFMFFFLAGQLAIKSKKLTWAPLIIIVGMFILGRIVLGMGFPFIAVGALAIVGELAHPKERPILTSLFAASGFVGAIVAAGSALGTYAMDSSWSWRIPSSLQLGPVVLQLIFIW